MARNPFHIRQPRSFGGWARLLGTSINRRPPRPKATALDGCIALIVLVVGGIWLASSCPSSPSEHEPTSRAEQNGLRDLAGLGDVCSATELWKDPERFVGRTVLVAGTVRLVTHTATETVLSLETGRNPLETVECYFGGAAAKSVDGIQSYRDKRVRIVGVCRGRSNKLEVDVKDCRLAE